MTKIYMTNIMNRNVPENDLLKIIARQAAETAEAREEQEQPNTISEKTLKNMQKLLKPEKTKE